MYEEQILRILLDVGAHGISVLKLAKHVYNHYCTLFYQPDFRQVHRSVQQYLSSHSRPPQNLVERMDRRGYYRLNPRNVAANQQLMLQFSNDPAEEEEEDQKPAPDLSLSLFD